MNVFSNPSRPRKTKKFDSGELYRYYAGYVDAFVIDALQWCDVPVNGQILDPWNGAGTTTRVAQQVKINSIGIDLNPTMVIVGKANLVYSLDAPIIEPLAQKIVSAAVQNINFALGNPLRQLFSSDTADLLRSFLIATVDHLVSPWAQQSKLQLNEISPLPALFFVGIFNTARVFMKELATTNPTWLKTPRSETEKISIDKKEFERAFISEMERLAKIVNLGSDIKKNLAKSDVVVGDARALPLGDNSVNAIVTSPPYCTRLDYARSTMPELLMLESVGLAKYTYTRQKLMGSSTARKMEFERPSNDWGSTCQALLNNIYHHQSSASKTYYYSSHFNYFNDLSKSVNEMSRVLSRGGKACVVVQDSHYKELHNDLPQIFVEMAEKAGLRNIEAFKYPKCRSIRSINSASKAYREARPQTEVALLFVKEK